MISTRDANKHKNEGIGGNRDGEVTNFSSILSAEHHL